MERHLLKVHFAGSRNDLPAKEKGTKVTRSYVGEVWIHGEVVESTLK